MSGDQLNLDAIEARTRQHARALTSHGFEEPPVIGDALALVAEVRRLRLLPTSGVGRGGEGTGSGQARE